MLPNIETRATTPTLIVQHIHIKWTKTARGGHLAERRGAISNEFAVPTPPQTYDRKQHYIVHGVLFGERNEFTEPIGSQTTAPSIDTTFTTTNCTIELKDDSATVIYEWRDGAPERKVFDKSGTPVPVRKRLQVHPGKWVRVEYNGRFTGLDRGDWWYEHSIINVALVAPDCLDVFLTSKPYSSFQQLEHLWYTPHNKRMQRSRRPGRF
jgi:hypothetical protein